VITFELGDGNSVVRASAATKPSRLGCDLAEADEQTTLTTTGAVWARYQL